MKRFTRFLLVGGVGFLADAGLLLLLLAVTPLGPLPARLISAGCALLLTWTLNRHFAFSPSARGLAQEGARYGGVGITTSLVNLAIYTALLAALPAIPPLLALVVGSGIATLLSFAGYSRLVFDR